MASPRGPRRRPAGQVRVPAAQCGPRARAHGHHPGHGVHRYYFVVHVRHATCWYSRMRSLHRSRRRTLKSSGSCALHSRSRSPSTRWPIPPSNARSVRPESQPAGRADIRGEGRIRQPPGGSRTTYLVGQIGRGGVLRSGLGSRPRPLLRRRSCPGVPRQPRVFWVWLLGPLGAILAIPLAILAKAWWTPIPEPCRRTRLAREGAHRAVTYRLSAGSRTPKRATNQVSVVVEILRTG